jgi:hypothetical protein
MLTTFVLALKCKCNARKIVSSTEVVLGFYRLNQSLKKSLHLLNQSYCPERHLRRITLSLSAPKNPSALFSLNQFNLDLTVLLQISESWIKKAC